MPALLPVSELVSTCMGAMVIEFPGNLTFNHLDKVAARLIKYFCQSGQILGNPLGVLKECSNSI